MNWQEFECAALEQGFAQAYAVSVKPFSKWEKVVRKSPDVRWNSLKADPREIMPEAQSIVILVWAYRPYSSFPEGELTLDSYYVASQKSYKAVAMLSECLKSAGFLTNAAAPLPAKRALLRTGKARYGKNGLLSLDKLGTRFCLQIILTSAPFPTLDDAPEDEIWQGCANCDLCLRSCPVNAILPNARIDTARCLRAQSYSEPVPKEFRAQLGSCVLGCDICQRVCPRNAAVDTVEPEAKVLDALRLDRLLAGDVKQLAELIGSNYARPVRMQARAALHAANLQRKDMLPVLEKLCEHEFKNVREHAQWAVEMLK